MPGSNDFYNNQFQPYFEQMMDPNSSLYQTQRRSLMDMLNKNAPSVNQFGQQMFMSLQYSVKLCFGGLLEHQPRLQNQFNMPKASKALSLLNLS